MARTMSVKIPVSALISDIEKSIAKIDEDVSNYSAVRIEYEEALKQYELDVVAHALKILNKPNVIGTDHSSLVRIVRTNYGSRPISLEFDTDALGFPEKPEEPKRPNQTEWFGRENATRKQILERNLKVLRMTTQEEVSASSYSSVMELI